MRLALREARVAAHTLGTSRSLGSETVPLADGHGRTLAADLLAGVSLPVADSSAMDGWAVGSAGVGPWRIDGAVSMGAVPGAPLAPDAARAITTGGAVPPAAAGIVRLEHGTVRDDMLMLTDPARPVGAGADTRRSGEEARLGERIAPAGIRVSPAVVAAAAATGADELIVVRRPRVALVLIGDEVIESGIPRAGQVRDTYGPVLPALLEGEGCVIASCQRLRDDADAVREALGASGVDAVISTGGTGGSSADHVVAGLEALGSLSIARDVAIRPGHPTIVAARSDGVPVIALPGNPFAALAALVALGLPVLAGMVGAPPDAVLPRVAGVPLEGRRGVTRLMTVVENADGVAPVDRQGSAMVSGMVGADALALVPESGVEAGAPVGVLPLPWRR